MRDLVIIGAGPTGINCAIAAKKAGLDYQVIEKGLLVNSIFHFPANMTFFSTSENLEIGDVPFISHTDKPTRREAMEYYRRLLDSYELNISFHESAKGTTQQSDKSYVLHTSKRDILTKNIIIATGFYDVPNLMDVPGEDLRKVKHYYDEVHHYIQQNVLVIGGANSACDVALECWQKGANVTMAVRSSELYERVKYWILPNIKNRIKEGSIKAYFDTSVKLISETTATLVTPTGEVEVENDFVLAMTGYSPDYSLLESLGITFDDDQYRTPIFNSETLESEMPSIYLAGVVNGGMKTNRYFIENTRDHAAMIIGSIRK